MSIDVSKLYLPKWPQMIVTGESVSESQALEIIRRTDDFFTWGTGNNHEFVNYVKNRLKVPDFIDFDEFPDYMEYKVKWDSNWGFLHMNYVVNSWISCCYIGGPHGWCHPDGTIGYFDNIGKWPSVEEVLDDWKKIAKEFPFLKLEVSLMNGEAGEEDPKPVVSMLIREGEVEVIDPSIRDIHFEFGRDADGGDAIDEEWLPKILERPLSFENAIPITVIESWASEFIDGKTIMHSGR